MFISQNFAQILRHFAQSCECMIATLSEWLISILKTVKDLVARSDLLPKARNTAGLLTAHKYGSQLPSGGELQHQGELPDWLDLLSQLLY